MLNGSREIGTTWPLNLYFSVVYFGTGEALPSELLLGVKKISRVYFLVI